MIFFLEKFLEVICELKGILLGFMEIFRKIVGIEFFNGIL